MDDEPPEHARHAGYRLSLARVKDADELLVATDWLQCKVSEQSTSPEASAVLAEDGRTKRVRAAVARRLS